MKLTNRLGFILLAAFLIFTGLSMIVGLTMMYLQYVLGGLAIAAGVCLLVDK